VGILDTDITTQFPVKISQTKSRFERLIARHGQWVRWRVAQPCPCVTRETNQPDIHCEKCGGTGEIYTYQKTRIGTLRARVRDNILELPDAEYEALRVYDSASGAEFAFSQIEQYVEITGGERPTEQNEMLECLYREPLVRRIADAALVKIGGGFYRVPGVETAPRKLEGVYYRAPGDVLAVGSVKTATGGAVQILGYRQDMVQVASDLDALTAHDVEYLLPYTFAVLSQERYNAEPKYPVLPKGDAICVFPAAYHVGKGDVITVLSGTETGKLGMMKRNGADDDTIPEFFVTHVASVTTKTAEYYEGVDFVLTGTNRIHWLSTRRPTKDEYLAIMYEYHPTYRVAQSAPNLRTSEDQRMPRRVTLELFSNYQKSRKVERNG
jgi:hypothetical protein